MVARLLIGFINFFTAVAVFFLGLRVILRLFGADPNVPFVEWIYSSSGTLLEPFRGIFPTAIVGSDHVIDFSALFAMIVYGLVGLALMSLVGFLTPSTHKK